MLGVKFIHVNKKGPWSTATILTTSNLQYKPHLSRQYTCWSVRFNCDNACRCRSKYIFILDSMPCFNGLGKTTAKRDARHLEFGICCVFLLADLWFVRYYVSHEHIHVIIIAATVRNEKYNILKHISQLKSSLTGHNGRHFTKDIFRCILLNEQFLNCD